MGLHHRRRLISRLAIVAGLVVVTGYFRAKPLDLPSVHRINVVRNEVKFQQQQDHPTTTTTKVDDPTKLPSPAALYRDVRGGFSLNTTTTMTTTMTKKKPWCIWHVGPPKTATTTIQQDLTEFMDKQFLSQDNYTYSGLCWREGRYCGRGKFLVTLTGRARKCLPKLRRAKRNLVQRKNTTYTRQELYHVLYHEAGCEGFTSLVDQLNDMHAHGGEQSIVVSDEQLSSNLPGYATIWNLLQEILGDQWNFGVLIGYRRWMDFLPSRKWQNNLNNRRTWRNWPGEKRGARKIQPLFPMLNGVTSFESYTDWALKQLKTNSCQLPMRIFNMNAATPERSLRSILFCDVIPNMDASCQESLRLDGLGKEPLVGGAKSWECDMLAVAAKEAGLIHPNIVGGRVIVGKAACEFHKQQQQSNNNETFPPICPTRVEMEAFLNISLDKERAIMPDLHQDAVFGEHHHRDKFWNAVAENKYCTINTTAILQQEKWKHFFTNLVNAQETMNQLQAAVQ